MNKWLYTLLSVTSVPFYRLNEQLAAREKVLFSRIVSETVRESPEKKPGAKLRRSLGGRACVWSRRVDELPASRLPDTPANIALTNQSVGRAPAPLRMLPLRATSGHSQLTTHWLFWPSCPSIRFHSNFWTVWPLTLTLCKCVDHDRISPGKVKATS